MRAAMVLAILFSLIPPCIAGVTSQAIELNNKGVLALSKGDWQGSIKYFRESLKAEPSYDLARKNLSIAYSNIGLQTQSKAALRYFQKAVFLSPENKTSNDNLAGSIKKFFAKNPDDFDTRIQLANIAQKENDLIAVYVELKAALNLKDDPDTRKRLDEICKQIRASEEYDEFEKGLLNPKDHKIILNKPVESIVLPGNLQPERKALLSAILVAKSRGVGISNYMAAFESIERKVKSGASSETLQKDLDRLLSALEAQVSSNLFAVSLTRERPKTEFFLKLQAYLKGNLQATKIAAPCEIDFCSNKSGLLTNIQASKDNKSSKTDCTRIIESLNALKDIPSSPVDKLRFHLKVGKDGKLVLRLRDKVDYSKYIAYVERTIKNSWNPPRDSKTKEIQVAFTIELNGKVSDIEVTTSTGEKAKDGAAIKAIKDAGPFPFLPDGSTGSIRVRFTFDYKVRKKES